MAEATQLGRCGHHVGQTQRPLPWLIGHGVTLQDTQGSAGGGLGGAGRPWVSGTGLHLTHHTGKSLQLLLQFLDMSHSQARALCQRERPGGNTQGHAKSSLWPPLQGGADFAKVAMHWAGWGGGGGT